MDIAATGVAATQVSGAQRQQSAAMAGLKAAAGQSQSLIAMLTAATMDPAQTQAAVPATSGNSGSATPDRRLPRGSIVNILA